MMASFVDMGSRYLSASAGGCFDTTNDNDNNNGATRRHLRQALALPIQDQSSSFLRRTKGRALQSQKVHYIRLTKLEDKGMNCTLHSKMCYCFVVSIRFFVPQLGNTLLIH